MKKVRRQVGDLGIAAYVMMHGFHVIGRKSRTFYFEVEEGEALEFDRLTFEYASGTYRQFDTSLMSLKKIGEYMPDSKKDLQPISDLGSAAYLVMHGFKIAGRRGKTVFFDVSEKDIEEFKKLSFEYISTTYHAFDSCLMLLKKVGEYVPMDNPSAI